LGQPVGSRGEGGGGVKPAPIQYRGMVYAEPVPEVFEIPVRDSWTEKR